MSDDEIRDAIEADLAGMEVVLREGEFVINPSAS